MYLFTYIRLEDTYIRLEDTLSRYGLTIRLNETLEKTVKRCIFTLATPLRRTAGAYSRQNVVKACRQAVLSNSMVKPYRTTEDDDAVNTYIHIYIYMCVYIYVCIYIYIIIF